MKKLSLVIHVFFLFFLSASSQLIVDHTCTAINQIPQSAIETAKQTLHIAYGHTSHGSQLTTGMTGLIDFANSGGRGLDLPDSIYAWNNGGKNGALDLHDKAMGGDVGYYPAWYDNTVSYLNNSANSDVNVIMWSWCGQVGKKYSDGVLWDEFLEPMSRLEKDYPNITFVYMTGHLDYGNRANVNAANDSIRSFCRNNKKVLFDFADIESVGPDGTNYKNNADDGCDFYNSSDVVIGNWAQAYMDSHTEGADWYSCGASHSKAFNANLKAYASWWMFASIAGWNYSGIPLNIETKSKDMETKLYPNPASDYTVFEVLTTDSNLAIELVSAKGSVIAHKLAKVQTQNGYSVNINTSSLYPGTYFIRARTQEHSETFKLMVIR